MTKTRLAIIDWGIGGISILKLIKEQIGSVPVIYFSDTGSTPYGKMAKAELADRLTEVLAFLKTQGATHVVIGCNAASTVLPDIDHLGLAIAGMIDSGVAATLRHRPARLGLLGGRRTVMSRSYPAAFKRHGVHVRQRVAQPLSGLIENGDTTSAQLAAECRRILAPLKSCSHILLACTHYPAILPILRQFTGGQTIFIDPAIEIVSLVSGWKLNSGRGSDMYMTTGSPAKMRTAAKAAFDWDVTNARQVNV